METIATDKNPRSITEHAKKETVFFEIHDRPQLQLRPTPPLPRIRRKGWGAPDIQLKPAFRLREARANNEKLGREYAEPWREHKETCNLLGPTIADDEEAKGN
jgi:hypothetical protein